MPISSNNNKLIFSILFVFALTSFGNSLFAQPDKENITAEVYKFTSAFIDQNYELAAEHTHKAVIANSGGMEAHIAKLKLSNDLMKKEGVIIDELKVEEQITIDQFSETEFHCIVPVTITLSKGDETISNTAYMFGWSDAAKKDWVFAELASLRNEEKAQQLIPGFKTNLEFPAK